MREKRKPDGTLTFRTVLKLKLQVGDEQRVELARMAELCRRGRNAGSVNWLMRQHGFPLSERQIKRHRAPSAKELERLQKRGGDLAAKSESTYIYHAVAEVTAGLTATVRSMLAAQVASYLSGKLDWREGKTEDGKRPRRRDAINKGDARPPYYTATEIPIRAAEATFRYSDDASLTFRVLASGATTVSLSTRQFSSGQRTLLKELSAKQRKLTDSKLLLKNDNWYWYLTLEFDAPVIQSERTAELRVRMPPGEAWQGRREHPCDLTLPGRDRPWGCGLGEWYVDFIARLETRRKRIGERYRHRAGTGHGRDKWDTISHRLGASRQRATDEFRRQLIVEIVDHAERAGCGTVLYHEPSLPLREKCWFAMRGVEWDYTRFVMDLENALARRGIRLTTTILKLKNANESQHAA